MEDDIRRDFEKLMSEKALPIERDMLGDYHASYVHAAFVGYLAACQNPPKAVRETIVKEFLATPQTSGKLTGDVRAFDALCFKITQKD